MNFSFLSKYSSTFFGFALLPNIISVCEKPNEVAFSLLNQLITSEKNSLVQEQFWRVWIIESSIWQYLQAYLLPFHKETALFLVTITLCKILKYNSPSSPKYDSKGFWSTCKSQAHFVLALSWVLSLLISNCQRASRAKTLGWRGGRE